VEKILLQGQKKIILESLDTLKTYECDIITFVRNPDSKREEKYIGEG
jgi:hypothetical protein